ncbi:hypothetical protein Ais01nite_67690 [Asanoa ishikariensis]|nr:hypothetical protein Ais01nite_67690 [Asanoa ishikariensis]
MDKEGVAEEAIAAAAARVASIVEHRSGSSFVLLLQLADRHFADPGFEDVLGRYLRENQDLVERWDTWSGDQRWTPSVYIEGTEVGWYSGVRSNVRVHPDRGTAAADFISRLARWLSRREVVKVEA